MLSGNVSDQISGQQMIHAFKTGLFLFARVSRVVLSTEMSHFRMKHATSNTGSGGSARCLSGSFTLNVRDLSLHDNQSPCLLMRIVESIRKGLILLRHSDVIILKNT